MLPEGSFPLSNLGPGAGQQAEILLRSQARQGGVHGTGRVYNIVRGSTLYNSVHGTVRVYNIFRECTVYTVHEQVKCTILSESVQ